jgi:hypothetical protein
MNSPSEPTIHRFPLTGFNRAKLIRLNDLKCLQLSYDPHIVVAPQFSIPLSTIIRQYRNTLLLKMTHYDITQKGENMVTQENQ